MAMAHQALLSEAELKKALTGIMEARRRYADAGPATGSRLPTDRSALQKAFGPALAQAGIAADAFDKIRAQAEKQWRGMIEKRRAEALERAAYAKADFRRTIDSRRSVLEQLLASAAAPPTRVVLDKPFLILQTPGVFIEDTHVEPFQSFAKFKLDSSKDTGYEELNFYYVFQNPSDRFAVVNVLAFIALHGFCRAGANGGFFPGDRYASLSITVRLNVLEWWNQPPTSPPPQASQQFLAATLKATAYDFGDPGDIEVLDVSHGYELDYYQFILPPKAVAVFEPTVAMGYGTSDGVINIDFATGDFEVRCPLISVDILT
jgi:hypothetical protein